MLACPPMFVPFALAPLLADLAEMLRSAIGPDISLHVETEQDLAPTLADHYLAMKASGRL